MKHTSARLILLLAYFIYVLFGMFTAGVGPVLGELSRQAGSSLSAIGGVLTFLFLGSLLAQLVAGPLFDRYGQKPVMVASLLILGTGIFGLAGARTLASMFAWALFTGVGQGGVDMASNLVVADAAPGNTTSALNLLHFFFGVGAFIGPALIALAIRLAGSGIVVHCGVAALFLALAVVLLAALRDRRPHLSAAAPGRGAAAPASSIYLSSLLWLLGVLLLVYVGVEFAVGSWIPSYMRITTGMSAEGGAWLTSAYWAALAAGRLAGAATGGRFAPTRLLAFGIGGGLIGVLGLLLSASASLPTVLSLVWISFSYGTVYPTTVAVATDAFAQDRGKALSVLVALGNVGGISLPWLAGVLLAGVAPFAYLSLLALLLLILAVIVWLVNRTVNGRRVLTNA